MSDHTLVTVEGLALTLLIVAYALVVIVRRLSRTRPDFAIGKAILTGVGLRIAAVAGIGASGLDSQLRGGDEQTFLNHARILAETPWGRGFLPHDEFELHTNLFAAQIKLADLTEGALRVTQVGIATLGIVLICAAIYDLAGPGASRIAAWVLAFEPASIFFSGAIHKEPLMVLASGLVVFGGSKLWRRVGPVGVAYCAAGCTIAVTTRDYAGWFLVCGAVMVLLHAAVRRLDQPGRAMPVLYVIVGAAFMVAPTIADVTSDKSLERLQISQTANAEGIGQGGRGGSNAANLALEQVDFSTRGAVVRNLPKRVYDLTFRPYPWQLQNPSQQLGAIGTLTWIGILGALGLYGWRLRGEFLALTGPLLYPMLFLLVAYSVSAGNAGTGFRYRSHIVVLGIAMVAIMRERAAPAPVGKPLPVAMPVVRKPTPEAAAAGTVALERH